MKRRQFLTIVGAGAASWGPIARAHAATQRRRVGVLFGLTERDKEGATRVNILREKLAHLGWISSNVEIIVFWGEGDKDLIRKHASDLADLNPDVVLATNTPTLRAALMFQKGAPIVFVNVGDPVAVGAVGNLAHPGRNVTGFSLFEPTMGSKWLEILREVQPEMKSAGALFSPEASVPDQYLLSLEAAAAQFSMTIMRWPYRDRVDIEHTLANAGSAGLIVLPDPFAVARREFIIKSANASKLVSIYPFRQYALDGGLISYGVDLNEQYSEAASYIDKILNGASASELPVQAPSKFDLVLNLKTAEHLGMRIPPTLLARADEVIE